jgi:hypothetical protein
MMQNLGGFVSNGIILNNYKGQRIYAVSPNFFKIVSKEFLTITEQRSSGFELSEQLYSIHGQNKMIIGEAYRKSVNLNGLNSTYRLKFNFVYKNLNFFKCIIFINF